MIGTVLGLLGGWKKWLAVGLAFLLLAGWLGIEKLRVANLRAENATLKGVVDLQAERLQRATADILDAGRVNRDNMAVLIDERAQCQARTDALTIEHRRQMAQANSLKIVKEKIHVEAQKCVGLPPAYLAADDWLRDNPDPSASGGEGAGAGSPGHRR